MVNKYNVGADSISALFVIVVEPPSVKLAKPSFYTSPPREGNPHPVFAENAKTTFPQGKALRFYSYVEPSLGGSCRR